MRFVDSRWFKICAGLLAVFIFYHSWYINHDKDFDIFIEGSKFMFRGESPYELWLGNARLKYYYSPFFAMILFPLKETPQLFYAFVWTALNFYFLFSTWKLLAYFFDTGSMETKQRRLFFLFCFLCCVRFVLDNLSLGQMTPMLLWASLEIVRLDQKGKWFWAGALLALVINIKLLPIALLCYFFYKGSWKTAFCTIAVSVALVLIPALAWGFDFNRQLHLDWLHSLSGTSVNSIIEDDNRPGLSSWIPALVMETPVKFGVARNFVTLEWSTVQLITNAARALLTIMGLFLISRPFVRVEHKLSAFYDLAVICMSTPLVYPHQGKYALLYTLPAYAVVIFYLLRNRERSSEKKYRRIKVFLLISFTLVTLTTDGLITRKGSDFAEYFHLLTYGTFVLLAAVWSVRKNILPLGNQT